MVKTRTQIRLKTAIKTLGSDGSNEVAPAVGTAAIQRRTKRTLVWVEIEPPGPAKRLRGTENRTRRPRRSWSLGPGGAIRGLDPVRLDRTDRQQIRSQLASTHDPIPNRSSDSASFSSSDDEREGSTLARGKVARGRPQKSTKALQQPMNSDISPFGRSIEDGSVVLGQRRTTRSGQAKTRHSSGPGYGLRRGRPSRTGRSHEAPKNAPASTVAVGAKTMVTVISSDSSPGSEVSLRSPQVVVTIPGSLKTWRKRPGTQYTSPSTRSCSLLHPIDLTLLSSSDQDSEPIITAAERRAKKRLPRKARISPDLMDETTSDAHLLAEGGGFSGKSRKILRLGECETRRSGRPGSDLRRAGSTHIQQPCEAPNKAPASAVPLCAKTMITEISSDSSPGSEVSLRSPQVVVTIPGSLKTYRKRPGTQCTSPSTHSSSLSRPTDRVSSSSSDQESEPVITAAERRAKRQLLRRARRFPHPMTGVISSLGLPSGDNDSSPRLGRVGRLARKSYAVEVRHRTDAEKDLCGGRRSDIRGAYEAHKEKPPHICSPSERSMATEVSTDASPGSGGSTRLAEVPVMSDERSPPPRSGTGRARVGPRAQRWGRIPSPTRSESQDRPHFGLPSVVRQADDLSGGGRSMVRTPKTSHPDRLEISSGSQSDEVIVVEPSPPPTNGRARLVRGPQGQDRLVPGDELLYRARRNAAAVRAMYDPIPRVGKGRPQGAQSPSEDEDNKRDMTSMPARRTALGNTLGGSRNGNCSPALEADSPELRDGSAVSNVGSTWGEERGGGASGDAAGGLSELPSAFLTSLIPLLPITTLNRLTRVSSRFRALYQPRLDLVKPFYAWMSHKHSQTNGECFRTTRSSKEFLELEDHEFDSLPHVDGQTEAHWVAELLCRKWGKLERMPAKNKDFRAPTRRPARRQH